MGASITFTGGPSMRARLTAVGSGVRASIAKRLYEFGQGEIITPSQDRVPVEFGVLKNSKFVEQPVWVGNTCTVVLGYGGAAAAYAIVQHEDMEFHHTVGGPKYLESVMNEKAPMFADWMGTHVRGDLAA